MNSRQKLVVIGNGMVGHRFLEALEKAGGLDRFAVTVLGEEPQLAYDRVNLSKFFEGKGFSDLALAEAETYLRWGIDFITEDAATAVDTTTKRVTTATGKTFGYDQLVLATGSYPFVPPIKNREATGCFVYRTVSDLEAIEEYAKTAESGVVLGGGLLGLEAANALRNLGLETHVVQLSGRLMDLQVDDPGAAILKSRIEGLGVGVHLSKQTKEIRIDPDSGRVTGLSFADGGELPADLVIFSAGIRPRDELAKSSGLVLGPRGGFAIDNRCRASAPGVFAIGECAAWEGRTYGLVAPGYRMAEIAVEELTGQGDTRIAGFDMSTKLKLMGVDVASFGDAFGLEAGAHSVSLLDTVAGVYKKLVVSADKQRLLGGVLVGEASAYAQLHQIFSNGMTLPPHPEDLILPPSDDRKPTGFGVDALPPTAMICSCHNVTKGGICGSISEQKLTTVGEVKKCTKAGTGCGSCVALLGDILKFELKKSGIVVNNHICEHFPFSRQELFHLTRIHTIKSFDDLLSKHGKGKGCEICKPAVASILASLWNDHILDGTLVSLQDTNDRFLANIQRDGTYSVVPRVAGGEITPAQLVALGTVAGKYGLYTKITGGQRIDLFGARLDQLPHVWAELIAAGFESGHAYGKSLRTVKSCVGSTWCRYGVQDSVGMAVVLENRYKGLRSPHKLKSAVSGCARECAEAQSKDFGIIATERGWNLYVCGNGGMKPQHAQLLAADIDDRTLIRYIDRFLMFYIRTGDRLERTATWLNKLEGGLEYLRRVVVEDSLGIGAELEAEMARVINSYRCEWKATLEDSKKLQMFRTFVNSDEPDVSVVVVRERAQHRPAFWKEKKDEVGEAV